MDCSLRHDKLWAGDEARRVCDFGKLVFVEVTRYSLSWPAHNFNHRVSQYLEWVLLLS